MKPENVIVPMAALVVGAAAGCAIAYGLVSPEQASDGSGEAIEALVKENEELKARLESSEKFSRRRIDPEERSQRVKTEIEKADTGVEETPVAADGGGWRRGPSSPREWMENLKKENPEEYARMTNGMARMRQARIERAQAKLDFFDAIDMSKMGAADREKAEALQSLLVKREELMAKMNPENDMTDEEHAALWQEMQETERSVRLLNRDVRDALLKATASTLGLDDEAAADMAETVKEIYEATGNGFGGPGGPRGPRG